MTIKHNKGDLVKANTYGAWSVDGPLQKPMFHRYELLAIVLENISPQIYRLHLLSDDKMVILHEDDIKCIVS
jgi:hypothetical protein